MRYYRCLAAVSSYKLGSRRKLRLYYDDRAQRRHKTGVHGRVPVGSLESEVVKVTDKLWGCESSHTVRLPYVVVVGGVRLTFSYSYVTPTQGFHM